MKLANVTGSKRWREHDTLLHMELFSFRIRLLIGTAVLSSRTMLLDQRWKLLYAGHWRPDVDDLISQLPHDLQLSCSSLTILVFKYILSTMGTFVTCSMMHKYPVMTSMQVTEMKRAENFFQVASYRHLVNYELRASVEVSNKIYCTAW
jgi:hypothetical protein